MQATTGPARAALLAFGLGVTGHPVGASAEPFVPDDDHLIVERLPASVVAARDLARRLDAGSAHPAGDLDAALARAREHIRIARAEGDPRHHGYAQGALAPWWSLPAPPAEVLLLRAVVRQARHDFEGALDDLERVLEREPANARAWLTRSTILRVRGELRAAQSSCQPLLRLVDPIVAIICISAAAGDGVDSRAAHDGLARALAGNRRLDPELRVWALTILGELAVALGEASRAERHFRAALDLRVRDVYLLGAYADLLLDENRPREVRELLRDQGAVDGLLLRLALAERRLGDPALDSHVAELMTRFAASRRRGDTVHLRDAARAALELLEEPGRALALALENWRAQREPWDARLVLESALAAGRPGAADEVLEWLRSSGTEHQRLETLAVRLEEHRRERAL